MNKLTSITILITIIIDLLNMRFYPKIQSFLYSVFSSTRNKTVYTYLEIYVLFIILLVFISFMSVYSGNQLIIREKNFWQKALDVIFGLMIVGYLIILLFPVIQLIIPGTEKSLFLEKQQQIFMSIFFVLFFLVIFIAFSDWKPRFYPTKTNYILIYTSVLVLVNFFLQFSSVLWRINLQSDTIQTEALKGKILMFLVILPIYLLFFSAPRFLLLIKTFNWGTFTLAMISSLFFAWKSATYI